VDTFERAGHRLAMSSLSARLLLVRHAQTHPLEHDGVLTELGKQQAETLAGAVQMKATEQLISSPLQRAVETASAIRRSFEVIGDLEEFRFGPDAPKTPEMVEQRTDLTLWRSDHGFPGGETLGEFLARVARVLEELVAGNVGGRVVAVTHSGFIDAALRWGYGVASDAAWTTEAVLPNASITEIEHWPWGRHPKGASRFTLVQRVGDVSHLQHRLLTDI
jgi:broad specificity phosphatase PhoE